METPTVEGYLKDTQQAVWLHKNGCSWRKFGAAIDVPHGILHAIANGSFQHVSWDTVRIVRRHLGLFDPGPIVETFACPDCDEGEPHTTRCHGKPVAAVVCLAPDETVRPVAKAQRPRRTPYGALSLRRTTLDRLAQHRTGRTADALINALLDKWEQEPQP